MFSMKQARFLNEASTVCMYYDLAVKRTKAYGTVVTSMLIGDSARWPMRHAHAVVVLCLLHTRVNK